jgi:hypothetical protein
MNPFIILVIVVFTTSCSARVSTGNFAPADAVYTKVTVPDLLNYKAFYHLKPIAVEDRYTCGFERSDVKLLVKIAFDTTIKYYD